MLAEDLVACRDAVRRCCSNLCGCPTPFILRSDGEEWNMIEVSHFHKIMFDEAVEEYRTAAKLGIRDSCMTIDDIALYCS